MAIPTPLSLAISAFLPIPRVHLLEFFRHFMPNQFSSCLHHLNQGSIFHYFLVWLHIAIAISVNKPDRPGIYPDYLSDFVHLHFNGERGRGYSKATHGAPWLA